MPVTAFIGEPICILHTGRLGPVREIGISFDDGVFPGSVFESDRKVKRPWKVIGGFIIPAGGNFGVVGRGAKQSYIHQRSGQLAGRVNPDAKVQVLNE